VKWLGEEDKPEGWILSRRGCTHGRIAFDEEGRTMPSDEQVREAWQAAMPVRLPGMLLSEVEAHADDIRDALSIMQRVRGGESCAGILLKEPYISRLKPDFDVLASKHSEREARDIEKVSFDVVKSGELFAENLWMKVSCISSLDMDDSLRFSFGTGAPKNQKNATLREELAAELATRIFPECRMLSAHRELCGLLAGMLGFSPMFVQRRIYANSPGGGRHMQDHVEAGHFGIVFAQLFGHTAWLALPRSILLDEIATFLTATDAPEFADLKSMSQKAISDMLASDHQCTLKTLLNDTPTFTRQLINKGHGMILAPGDILLLPQQSSEHCCWSSVFCLDDEPGHSLSFSITRPA